MRLDYTTDGLNWTTQELEGFMGCVVLMTLILPAGAFGMLGCHFFDSPVGLKKMLGSILDR